MHQTRHRTEFSGKFRRSDLRAPRTSAKRKEVLRTEKFRHWTQTARQTKNAERNNYQQTFFFLVCTFSARKGWIFFETNLSSNDSFETSFAARVVDVVGGTRVDVNKPCGYIAKFLKVKNNVFARCKRFEIALSRPNCSIFGHRLSGSWSCFCWRRILALSALSL